MNYIPELIKKLQIVLKIKLYLFLAQATKQAMYGKGKTLSKPKTQKTILIALEIFLG